MTNGIYATYTDDKPFDFSELMAATTLAFDIEGSGVSVGRDYPIGFSMAHNSTNGCYRPIDDTEFKSILGDETKLKIAFNAKYDRSMMVKAGLVLDNLADPMIAAHLLEMQNLSLKEVLHSVTGINVKSFSQLSKMIVDMSMEELADYSIPHSTSLFELWPILEKRMEQRGLLNVFWNVEMPLVPVLSDMEMSGVTVNPQSLFALGEYFDGKLAILIEALDHYAGRKGINYNSPQQVAELFYDELKITKDWKTGADGRSSVRGEHILKVIKEHPILPVYVQYKKYKTLRSNFVDGLLGRLYDGRVYGSFNQTRASTGRLSSSDPNLQNVPYRTEEGRKIRRSFEASFGHTLLKADKDQLELRMMGHVSQDPALLAAFRAGRDIHAETAMHAYGTEDERRRGKTLNFQIIFGGGTEKDRRILKKVYPRVFKWIEEENIKTKASGQARTIHGRIRTIGTYADAEDIMNYTGVIPFRLIAHGDREAISTVVQGSSAEIVKIDMRRVWKALIGSGVKILLQVHDEVVFDVPDNILQDTIHVVRESMTNNDLSLPMTVSLSTGQNWGEMKGVE